MLSSILLGLFLTLVTVGIHATGTTWWIDRLRRKADKISGVRRRSVLQIRLFGSTAIALLILHIAEITVWAIVYCLLPNLNEINTFEDAVYFSTVTFTTLGYGDIVITGSWRLLAAVQAMAGLLIFGWSTALLFAVVQRVLEAGERE